MDNLKLAREKRHVHDRNIEQQASDQQNSSQDESEMDSDYFPTPLKKFGEKEFNPGKFTVSIIINEFFFIVRKK